VWNLAWRDLRFARRRLLLAILAMTAGVAAMSGVNGLSARMRRMLSEDARQWIGADVAVSLADPLTEEEQQFVAELKSSGVRFTEVVDTHAMIASDAAPAAVPATLKIVDPSSYPLYGEFRFEPAGSLAGHLRGGWVLVSAELPQRLAVRTGDRIRLNDISLRIAAVVVSEPDRFAGYPSPMLRVLMTRQDYERSGLGRSGATHRYQLRFRASPQIDAAELRRRVDAIFSYAHVTDYRDPDPAAIQSFDATVTFLGLTAWMALVFGASGVGLTAYLHIRERLPAIAAMKSLGGTNRRITALYCLQTAGIGLAGSLAGVLCGRSIEEILASVATRSMGLPLAGVSAGNAGLQSIAAGVLSALAVTCGPLWTIRRIPPLAMLRRDYHVPALPGMLALGVPLAGLGSVALWFTRSTWVAGTFVAGIVLASLLLAAILRVSLKPAAEAVRRLTRGLQDRSPAGLAAWLRAAGYGARNLSRPSSRAPQMALALAVGILIMTASWTGQSALQDHVTASLSGHGADFFVIGATPDALAGMQRLVDHHPAARQPMEILPLVWMRLARVNGREVPPGTPRMWFSTCLGETSEEVSSGRWMRPGQAPAEVVVSAQTALAMRATVGSTLEFEVRGASLKAKIVGIRQLDRVRDAAYAVTFSCDAFRGLRPIYHGGVNSQPGAQELLINDLLRSFPAATIVRRDEFRAMLHASAGRAITTLHLMALLVLAAGTLLFMLLIGATRTYRAREIAITKMLGAGGRWVAASLAGEFGTLGAVSGFAGALLGCGFASLLVSVVLATPVAVISPLPVAAATVAGGLLAAAAGWLSTADMRSRRPLAILREE
jgi:putative ABC transport system permease protein